MSVPLSIIISDMFVNFLILATAIPGFAILKILIVRRTPLMRNAL